MPSCFFTYVDWNGNSPCLVILKPVTSSGIFIFKILNSSTNLFSYMYSNVCMILSFFISLLYLQEKATALQPYNLASKAAANVPEYRMSFPTLYPLFIPEKTISGI